MKIETQFPIKTDIPLAWGEMDSFQHINNIYYFRYMETGRVDYLQKIQIPVEHWKDTMGPILLKIDCLYLKPLLFPDTITIHTGVTKIGHTSLTIKQKITSPKLGEVSNGESVIVMYDHQQKIKMPIPSKIKEAILSIENC